MSGLARRARRWMGAAAVAAALGFGASQAVAAPRAAQAADRCADYTCMQRCINFGYAGGSCVGATCTCWQT